MRVMQGKKKRYPFKHAVMMKGLRSVKKGENKALQSYSEQKVLDKDLL